MPSDAWLPNPKPTRGTWAASVRLSWLQPPVNSPFPPPQPVVQTEDSPVPPTKLTALNDLWKGEFAFLSATSHFLCDSQLRRMYRSLHSTPLTFPNIDLTAVRSLADESWSKPVGASLLISQAGGVQKLESLLMCSISECQGECQGS